MGSWQISTAKSCARSSSLFNPLSYPGLYPPPNHLTAMNAISYSLRGVRRYQKPVLVVAIITPLALGASWVCGVRWDILWKGLADSAALVKLMTPEWDAFAEMLQPAL